jgi:outer membrane protein assembly factor BamB
MLLPWPMVEAASASPRNGVSCTWCGGKEEAAGGFCSACGRVIVHFPGWALAGARRRRLFTRRRIVIAICLLFLAGFVFWLNFPFLPDPVILIFRRPTTNLTSQSMPGQWSMSGGNLQRSRYVEQVERDVLGQTMWSVDLGGRTLSEPIVLGRVIYIGGHFKVVALDVDTGRTLWTKTTTGPVQASLAAAGDYLYVGLLDHRVLALDLKTGAKRWEFQTRGIVTAAPVVADGIVYVGSWDSFIYALDAATGKHIWRFRSDGPIRSPPSIHKGALFLTDGGTNLHVLSARTGQERLLYRTSGPTTRSPVTGQGLVYFPSGGRIFAVDSGAREFPGQFQLKRVWAQFWLWQVPGIPRPPGQKGGRWRVSPKKSSAGFTASPAVSEEAFYVGDAQGNLNAHDARNGQMLWRFRAETAIVSSPLIAGARVYFGTRDGSLYALGTDFGELIWQRNMGAPVEVSPVFAAGRLYVHTSDGRLHSIK